MKYTSINKNVCKAFAILHRDWLVAYSYKLQFYSSLFGAVIPTLVIYFLSGFIGQVNSESLQAYGGNYFAFVIVGMALSDYLFVSTQSFANTIRNGQVNGTFEALLVTPTSILTIIFSSYLYPFLNTTFRIAVIFFVGIFFCGAQFHINNVFLLLISFILTLLPFFGLGLFSAAFVIVFKQGSPINWLVGISSTLLGGVLYPVSALPAWLESFSMLIPLTHGIEAMRKVLLTPATLNSVHNDLLVLLCFSITFIIAGIFSVNYSLRIARKQGTLLHY